MPLSRPRPQGAVWARRFSSGRRRRREPAAEGSPPGNRGSMRCQVAVQYFARSTELAELCSETLSVPQQITSLQLWEEIVKIHPRSMCFLEISSWSCSLETRLPSSHQLVEAESVQALLSTTRNNFEGKKVIHFMYEVYTSVAETEIKKICRDVRQKWPSVKHIAVHHRLGVVPITEASVIISVSSPHRAESLEAVMYCINTLKASVPIWKKEIYEDEYSWKENKECFWANSEK